MGPKTEDSKSLIELLKVTSARVSLGDSWLVFDEDQGEWVVYQRPYGAKKTRTILRTTDLGAGVDALVGDL